MSASFIQCTRLFFCRLVKGGQLALASCASLSGFAGTDGGSGLSFGAGGFSHGPLT
jgi:hypothetical protein